LNSIDDFNNAVAKSKELTRRPTNEEFLDLYALFKQASVGDNHQDKPGGFDFKAVAKHDAWAAMKGKTKDQAIQEYVALVNALYQEYH
jgi:diazepam-binding inhibitor (GABA receptor modulator, acyl-CoA-binding protein)